MTIEVDVALRRGDFKLDAAFTAGAGLTALFGRSGSGKTTVIDLIAGLGFPDRGRIVIDGETLLDTARGIRVPVHRRRIGYVFQEARLMPHLSVRRNLGFGRWFARRRAGAGYEAGVIEMLGIGHLLERRPAGLSVAEVARLASTVVAMEAGRVVGVGPADAMLRRLDLIPDEAGAVLAMTVETHDEMAGLTRLVGPAGGLSVPRLAVPLGRSVRVRVPARDVLVATQRPVGLSARNVLAGRVSALISAGADAVMVEIDCNGTVLPARLTGASVRDLGLEPGHAVFAIVKSVAFDPSGVGTTRDIPVEI